MKYFYIFSFLIFTLFAYFNLNDPDPALWVSVYGISGLIFLLPFFKFNKPLVYLIAGSTLLIWSFTMLDAVYDWAFNHNFENIAQSMKVEKMYIEETRECFGLMITAFFIFILYFNEKKKY